MADNQEIHLDPEDIGVLKTSGDSPNTIVSDFNGRLRIVQHNMGGISLSRDQVGELIIMAAKWLEANNTTN